jgi:hypothetical protein
VATVSTAAKPVLPTYAREIPDYDLLVKWCRPQSRSREEVKIAVLVHGYLNSDEQRLIARAKTDSRFLISPLGSEMINLTDRATLARYIDPALSKHVESAITIAKYVYESQARVIPAGKGFLFPMNPEVLAYAMGTMPAGGVGLEFGSSSGEVGTLMAFSRAREMYLNDSDQVGMGAWASLPGRKEVAGKCCYIFDSCFNSLAHAPNLKHGVDLVLSFNLIHMFTLEERSRFLNLLKEVMKTGSQAIITANGAFAPNIAEVIGEFSDETETDVYQVFLVDQKGKQQGAIYQKFVPVGKNRDSKPALYTLYEKKEGEGWKTCPDVAQKIGPNLRTRIKEAMEKSSKRINEVESGTITLERGRGRFFNLHSIRSLFEGNGFEVVTTFLVGEKGHLSFALNPYKSGYIQSVGIIVRLPAASASPQPVTTAAK